MPASPRIRCAYRGHMWPDGEYFILRRKNKWGLKEVWTTTLHCERDGCERTRTELVVPRTFQRLTLSYGGRIEPIGRMSRDEMRKAIIKEQ